MSAATYMAAETLRDGRRLEIRALKPEDRAELVTAAGRASGQTLHWRFFGAKRSFSDKEIDFFVNVDFVNHVPLVAVVIEGGRPAIVGGARYIVVQPGRAEIAFMVIDQYQGQGIGAALLQHLAAIARDAGLKELIAEVLPNNAPMLKVFEKSRLSPVVKRDSQTVHVTLKLDAQAAASLRPR
ncbi:MAG TPA: GNAT family N-acetyltransferase [Alphaproteobacteria bacterium]|nr:GNAT family N-acetyltransferase [Alphaproteobacteria bacterium]